METVRRGGLTDLARSAAARPHRGRPQGPAGGGGRARLMVSALSPACSRRLPRSPAAVPQPAANARRTRGRRRAPRRPASISSRSPSDSGAASHRLHRRGRPHRGAAGAGPDVPRRALGADEGMLFPFDPPRPASFWMRNTLIPLDMIFIRPDGTHRPDRRQHRAAVGDAGRRRRAGDGGARAARRPGRRARHRRGRPGHLVDEPLGR